MINLEVQKLLVISWRLCGFVGHLTAFARGIWATKKLAGAVVASINWSFKNLPRILGGAFASGWATFDVMPALVQLRNHAVAIKQKGETTVASCLMSEVELINDLEDPWPIGGTWLVVLSSDW